MLAERLSKEVEGKRILPETQAGFRKGRGTTDNIVILNHLVDRELNGIGEKMNAFFVDLKTAFDRVDRRVLWKVMEERGIRKGLTERVKQVYKETRNKIKVEDRESSPFWTTKGVRQSCPLNPLLFLIFISDLEEEMARGLVGGMRIGQGRIWTLAYADDVVLLARKEEALEEMIKRLERYLEKKKLLLNVEKSKIMRFRRGGGAAREKN